MNTISSEHLLSQIRSLGKELQVTRMPTEVNQPGFGGDFLLPNVDWIEELQVKGLGAGASRTFPVISKTDPWQGHTKRPFSSIHGMVHPRWVHFREMAKNPPSSSRAR